MWPLSDRFSGIAYTVAPLSFSKIFSSTQTKTGSSLNNMFFYYLLLFRWSFLHFSAQSSKVTPCTPFFLYYSREITVANLGICRFIIHKLLKFYSVNDRFIKYHGCIHIYMYKYIIFNFIIFNWPTSVQNLFSSILWEDIITCINLGFSHDHTMILMKNVHDLNIKGWKIKRARC